ncbi:DRTGG domain-containing protein [Aerococcaceae bacterium NML190073]|nr:DRTGG domain-containing protein [Aerococcaceae bacterium NML190073]MCW6676072.1 DRTGG domain-containing protein [Aerococcaceae bacterium NML180378]
MATKHDLIIQHIESLPIGERISVRGIAKQLRMSEGTAYRAIKDAEMLGIVSTIERVGTIRIEKKTKYSFDMLTFKEVVRIIEGNVLGGEAGLERHLSKFIIGAMTKEAMVRYFTSDSLMIVGNREEIQLHALEHDVAVLITGGFHASQRVIDLANERSLPVISTTFDTFTVATVINRSMTDYLIKNEIMTIQDIYTSIDQTPILTLEDTIEDYQRLVTQTGLHRFPVCHNNRLIGVVAATDIAGKQDKLPIERVMTKDPVTVKTHMSIASVSHKMIWEDLEMIPVVEDNLQLIGMVTRQEVSKAIQLVQQQPQMVNTFEDDMMAHLAEYTNPDQKYQFRSVVQPQMINNFGTISYGVLSEFIANIAYRQVLATTKLNSVIEKIDLHYFNLIQIGNEIQFHADVFHYNRKAALTQVDVYHENTLAARAIVTSQIIERT